MNATAAENPAAAALSAAVRVLGLAALVIAGALIFAFAAATVVVLGLVVAGAALALRFAPRPKQASPQVLDAHETPNGWVVEMRTRRPQ
jgi:hypothetical protein